MTKFANHRTRPSVAISTSSLPDIIFILLFFFMVATVLRQQKSLLAIRLPEVSQVQKLRNPSLIHHIYIGYPQPQIATTIPAIQINDAFVRLDQVKEGIRKIVLQAPENKRQLVTTSLRVDKVVEMGIVADVKTEIRKAEQYNLNYAAFRRD